jgi:quercetin dioxygenase-like cupin family protein
VSVRLQFDRIPPGVEVGPHRHGVETIVYVAGGELVFVHGDELQHRTVVGAGDVLYEAPAEYHLVRNEGRIDALALLAADPEPVEPGVTQRRWDAPGEPVRRRLGARVVEADGIRRRLLVAPGDFGTATFAVEEVEMQPGVVDAWHRHPGAEHAMVVFEGRGVITVGRITETLEPLKGIRIEAGLAHRVENTGRTLLRYYVCGTPGTDMLADRERVAAPRRQLER